MTTDEKATAQPGAALSAAFFALGVFTTLACVGIIAGGFALMTRGGDALMVFSDRIDLALIMESDPNTFWALRPNLENEEFLPQPGGPPNSFRVSTNALGLRNPPIEAKAGRLRVLAIGDSTTFGQYVEDDESWPAQLQSLLNPEADQIEIINAGLIGATSFQGLSYLIHRGFDLDPDVVIATYGFNDRGQWNMADRRRLSESGPLRGLASLLRGAAATPDAPVEDLPRVLPGEFLDVMLHMARLCEERGIKLYFVCWPTPSQVEQVWDRFDAWTYQSLLFEAERRSLASVIDLREPLHRAPQPVFADIVHANAHGCGVVAETIAQTLRRDYPRALPRTADTLPAPDAL